MNFLAHIYLSGDSPKIMVGNFIGDFVKGNQLQSYEEDIQLGIRVHRAIDSYTDSHKVVKQSKVRLSEKYRHYSGVIVDVYYDHFLAKNWERFHNDPLEVYVKESYSTILSYDEILPKQVKRMLSYMIPQNWLVSYRDLDGIGQALTGLSKRTTFDSGMEFAINDLKEHYEEFESEFLNFFEDLREHVKNPDIFRLD